jgi:hypothetical protein
MLNCEVIKVRQQDFTKTHLYPGLSARWQKAEKLQIQNDEQRLNANFNYLHFSTYL